MQTFFFKSLNETHKITCYHVPHIIQVLQLVPHTNYSINLNWCHHLAREISETTKAQDNYDQIALMKKMCLVGNWNNRNKVCKAAITFNRIKIYFMKSASFQFHMATNNLHDIHVRLFNSNQLDDIFWELACLSNKNAGSIICEHCG